MEPSLRRAARLLVMDRATGALLLFQYEDDGRRWWATPGGALEGDETFEQAAIREAGEELAVFPPVSPMPVWRRTVEFMFRGTRIRQDEQFFLLHVDTKEIAHGPAVEHAHHVEGILAARWWSLDELRSSSEQVFPEDLALRVAGLETRRQPSTPTAPSSGGLDPLQR